MKPVILIDTREQTPWSFSEAVETRTATLATGDYSLAGFEDDVVIERKTLGDLLGSITHERERFVRELRRMRSARLAVLIVEASWGDVIGRRYAADVHPNAVMGSLAAFAVKHGVNVVMAGDRETAAVIAERMLMNFARIVERDYKALTARSDPDATADPPPPRKARQKPENAFSESKRSPQG